MSKMTDEEVIQLFKLDNNMSNATEIDEVKMLAIKLDYLPLCLALASSYIRITKTSIAKYNINWSELQEQAHDISEKGKNFDASYILTLKKLEKDLPANAKSLLKYIPHINYNVIPIQLLESLVESDSTSKEAVVNRLLTVLHDYSLAPISGAGESRIVSIHSVTVWFLDKKKTQDEKYAEKQFLLKHFCYHIDNDARLVEVMNRNVKFLDHACCLLKSLEKYRTENIEAQLFECYLYCSVAVTFQLYGNTQVSADYFFKKAKNLICEMIPCPKVGIGSPHTCATYMESDDINDLLFGDSVIQAKSKELFRVLTRKSREIPIEVIKNFVMKKIRSNRDIRLIKEYGNYTDNEFPNNQITERCFEKLTEQNVVLSMDDIQEIFLAELLITILYNHSKNIVFIAEANEAEKTFDYETIEQTLYINYEAILEFQISLNLARHVENFLCECQCDLHSVRYVLTKRGGINHFLNKVRNEKVINSIIKEMNTMQTDCEENRYFDFGVLKMSRNYNLYQRCMIQNILRKCYLDLSHISPIQVEYNINQALHHTEELEKILSQMEPWLALTNIHLDIAETYMVLVSPHAEKAKHHFRMALAKPGPTSRYKLKAYQSFIKFCYQQGKDDDFEIAEHFGKEVLLQSREEEQKAFVRKSLQNLRDKISKPTSPVPDHELTTDSQIFEGSEIGVIEGESINLIDESMFQTTATVQQHGNINSGNVLGTSVENPDSESSSRKTTDNKKDKHKTLSSFEERIFVKLDALESLQRELIEIERARLTIEREKLEIERNRFELEKQKLEVEMNK